VECGLFLWASPSQPEMCVCAVGVGGGAGHFVQMSLFAEGASWKSGFLRRRQREIPPGPRILGVPALLGSICCCFPEPRAFPQESWGRGPGFPGILWFLRSPCYTVSPGSPRPGGGGQAPFPPPRDALRKIAVSNFEVHADYLPTKTN
jgi:hypothetical protein